MEMQSFIKAAAHVVPDSAQLALMRETPFYAFVHFSPNTYTGLEWGDGTESPSIFNPTELDCDQWARAIKSAGMTAMVLTAKHHDGFCLWQSKHTEHCMKNSPYKNGRGDIVSEAAEACARHGLKFGFYLSPWDRNSKYYGSEAYNDYYKAQLTELLTGYGDIFYVWFDGACGEGPNGKKQEYDFAGYLELIKKYQPKAATFGVGSLRWCGNEAGRTGYAQWSVVPSELCPYTPIQTEAGPLSGGLEGIAEDDINLGQIANIIYSRGLVFAPAETDMSIRRGWFYHPEEEPHSLERLFDTYLRTVGGNTTMNLNIPPMPNGRLDERDVERLAQLGELIQSSFSVNLSEGIELKTAYFGSTAHKSEVSLQLPMPATVSFIDLAEKISEGQRVECFNLYLIDEQGRESLHSRQTTIGSRKIIRLDKPTRLCGVRLEISLARDAAEIEYIRLY